MAKKSADVDQKDKDVIAGKRILLFKRCATKKDLHNWIKVFLGLDLPDCIVCTGTGIDEYDSNSSPMDMVWEVYSKALQNNDPDFRKVIYYSARGGFKTLSAAVLEVLAIVHLDRDGAHMAAIEKQSKKSQQYIKGFLARPILRDFVVGNNQELIWFVRYVHRKTGHIYTEAEFEALSPLDQANCEEKRRYLSIVICTKQGANCISPGTVITLADGTQKVAASIRAGDQVRSYDTNAREWCVGTVSAIGVTVKPSIRISFSDGGSVVTSDDHRIFSSLGWRQAQSLRPGEEIFDAGLGKAGTTNEGEDLARYDTHPYEQVVLVGTQAAPKENTKEVTKIEWLPRQALIDIHVDTDRPDAHNFVANHAYLVHNSEHVSYFCVDGDTEIVTEGEGRKRKKESAYDIFQQLLRKNVANFKSKVVLPAQDATKRFLSLDTATGDWVYRSVVRAQTGIRQTLKVSTDKRSLICTADHPLYVFGRGFVQVGDIKAGDRVIVSGEGRSDKQTKSVIFENKTYESIAPANQCADRWDQAVLGSLLGDGGVYKKSDGNPYFSERHCVEQSAYLGWKESLLRERLRTIPAKNIVSGYTGKSQVGFRSGQTPLLLPYVDFKKTLSGVERLGPLGLAIWYMDDGCKGRGVRFSTESFTQAQNEKLRQVLSDNFGIEVEVVKTKKGYFYLNGTSEAKRRLSEICEPFIHPDLAYKFDTSGLRSNCRVCGSEYWHYQRNEGGRPTRYCNSAICGLVFNKVLYVEEVSSIDDAGERFIYDFTLESTHNYIGNGFLSKQCVDEIDVVADRAAYEESRFIPDSRDGWSPITVLISTRKYGTGLVQEEIDNRAKTGMHVRHWNIIDIMEACPPARHKPHGSRLTVYSSDSQLTTLNEEQYAELAKEKQIEFQKYENVMEGCATCPIFNGCKGMAATKQLSKSTLLKKIDDVIGLFKEAPLDTAQAQLLCRKPSKEGMIYWQLDEKVHKLTAAEICRKLTAEQVPDELTKIELLRILKTKGFKFFCGLDWGHTHSFVMVLFVTDGYNAYAIHVVSESGLDPAQKVEKAKSQIKPFDPIVYPDMAMPDMIALFRRPPPVGAGMRMKDWTKGPGSVLDGIETVRLLLRSAGGESRFFFLKDDPGTELLFERMSKYHWKIRPDGTMDKEPDKKDDDEPDAARYGLMNYFGPEGIGTKTGANKPVVQTSSPDLGEQMLANEAELNRQLLRQALIDAGVSEDQLGVTVKTIGNKFWID